MSANLSDFASYVKGSHLQSWMTNICTVFGIILPSGWILILSALGNLLVINQTKRPFLKNHWLLNQLLKPQASHNCQVVGVE